MQVGQTKKRNALVQRPASSRAHQHAAQAASDTGADARMEEEEEEAGAGVERQEPRDPASAPVLQTYMCTLQAQQDGDMHAQVC